MSAHRTLRRIALIPLLTLGLVVASPIASGAAPDAAAVTRSASTSQRHSILRLYRAYFLRAPDQRGWDHWSHQYSSGRMSLNAISDFFASSKEFRDRYGSLSDVEFIRLVYRNVLGRTSDQGGEQHWLGVMRAGGSRGYIMVGFSESVEFQEKTGTLPPATTQSWTDQMLARVNAERAKHGRAPLSLCATLTAAAQGHSADMARHNFMGHNGSNGSTFDSRIRAAGYGGNAWGENVAYGYTDVNMVVDAWMTSAGHRQNILNPLFTHMGVARAQSSAGLLYWTQDFGGGGRC